MMGKGIRYTDEFKQEAVNQVIVHGFFANLKKEKMRQIKYKTRADARHAMFNYIEMFYDVV